MQIDIISDITCPWCFIGLKRFGLALSRRPHYLTEIKWRPFLLNPELRDGILDRANYLERVFGSKSRIKQFYEAIGAAGKTVGIEFNIEQSEHTPSSINAHSVILLAEKYGKVLQMAELLYLAHFTNLQDISDPVILIDLASSIGIHAIDVEKVLSDENRYNNIYEDNTKIHKLGINGVPSYIFAGKNIISGAQEPETLLHMVDLMATLDERSPHIDTKKDPIRDSQF